jgi:hypothetical protein
MHLLIGCLLAVGSDLGTVQLLELPESLGRTNDQVSCIASFLMSFKWLLTSLGSYLLENASFFAGVHSYVHFLTILIIVLLHLEYKVKG